MRLFRRKSPSDQLDPQLTALRFESDGEGEHKKIFKYLNKTEKFVMFFQS